MVRQKCRVFQQSLRAATWAQRLLKGLSTARFPPRKEASMNEITTQKPGLINEIFKACRMGTGRTLATVGTIAVMAPLLFIALMPISLFMLLLLPAVGTWMAFGAMFGSDQGL
jgi:hypothetical protein